MEPSDWQGHVGTKWAEEWRRTDRSFAGLTERLLEYARAEPISHALDIGCGAGEISLALARSHAHVRICGVDISEALIAAAKSRGANFGNVQFDVADAALWKSDEPAPDLVLSRHGVMFFPDPLAAFINIRQNVGPNARLVFSSFRAVEDNPWAMGLMELLPPLSHPEASATPQLMVPGPFAFANRDAVTKMLEEAGWKDVEFEAVDFAYVAGTGPDPIADAKSYFLNIGPAARAAAQLTSSEKTTFLNRLDQFISRHRDEDLVAMPAAAWIVSARAPDKS